MTRDLRPKDVRRYLSALAVGGAVAVVTHPALATEPASPDPVTFEWTAPTVCPDREAVLARLRRNGAAAEGESPIHARVTVEELATDHYRAHVATAGGPDRVLDATSCEAIADAVAVILRVAAHAPEPRSTPASTPSTTPASANTPANTPANMPAIAPATELAPTPATALTPIEKGGRGSGFLGARGHRLRRGDTLPGGARLPPWPRLATSSIDARARRQRLRSAVSP